MANDAEQSQASNEFWGAWNDLPDEDDPWLDLTDEDDYLEDLCST